MCHKTCAHILYGKPPPWQYRHRSRPGEASKMTTLSTRNDDDAVPAAALSPVWFWWQFRDMMKQKSILLYAQTYVYTHVCKFISIQYEEYELKWKKTSKPALPAHCEGNPPVAGGFPSQKVGNAESISIVWRHHGLWFQMTIHILIIQAYSTLEWMPEDLVEGKSTLVQVMAWCRQTASHYLSHCSPRSMSTLRCH